jgi:hypothetical protein
MHTVSFLQLNRSLYEYLMKNNLIIYQIKRINPVALNKPFKWEKNEIGGACSSDGGGERRVQGFGGET